MRGFIVLIVLLADTLVSFAQNGVRGRLVEADGSPVIYAAVMLESGKRMIAGGNRVRAGGNPRGFGNQCRWQRLIMDSTGS